MSPTIAEMRAEKLAQAEADLNAWRSSRVDAGLPVDQAAYREYLESRGVLGRRLARALPRLPVPSPTMRPELAAHRIRLIVRLDELPIRPSPGQGELDLELRIEGTMWLIGWIEAHPWATMEQYRAEVRRTQEEGPMWPRE